MDDTVLCGKYSIGKRNAGARPASGLPTDPSVNVSGYGAEGDISNTDVMGYSYKDTWVCQSGEWIWTKNEGGCFHDGKCHNYNAVFIDDLNDPSGYNNATVGSIPTTTKNRALYMCNGVTPTGFSDIYPKNWDGSGGWDWVCPGQLGGTSESCHANYDGSPLDGVCGSAAGSVSSMPTKNYCRIGLMSGFTNPGPSGPWTWTCSGINGGASVNCKAYISTTTLTAWYGLCSDYYNDAYRGGAGLLASETFAGKPSANCVSTGKGLCYRGTLSGSITGNGTDSSPWKWTCTYTDFAGVTTTKDCENKYAKAGACGETNGTSIPDEPNKNMCSSGRWYSKVSGVKNDTIVEYNPDSTVKGWSWACLGYDISGGTPVQSDAACFANKCNSCTGTFTKSFSGSDALAISGKYDGVCTYSGKISFSGTVEYVADAAKSGDVVAGVQIGAHGATNVTVPTNIAASYCKPCYERIISAGPATITETTSCFGGTTAATVSVP